MKLPTSLFGSPKPRRAGTKVFCIGFNKTGTTSLHRFFVERGLSSVHETRWPHHSRVKDGAGYFDKAQCFSDGEASDFRQLDEWFPGSIFVLNTRNERAWLRSRVKHVLRAGLPPSREDVEQGTRYGEMARRFYANEAAAMATWLLDRRIYEDRVRRYFSGNPRFLEIAVADDPDWHEKLLAHLGAHGVVGPSDAAPPKVHANSRPTEEVPDRAALERYLDMADRILTEVDRLVGAP